MAQGVMIDIPGIGNVEAKNAATEATLREILKAMQGVQKNTASSGGAGGAGQHESGPRCLPILRGAESGGGQGCKCGERHSGGLPGARHPG